MKIFEKLPVHFIFSELRKRIQGTIFSDKRFIQLITLKPIELYQGETEVTIDTAVVKLKIDSQVENMMQRRIERTLDWLIMNGAGNSGNTFEYAFEVIIKALADYKDVSSFFNFHFAHKKYDIEPDKYALELGEFSFGNDATKMSVALPFTFYARWWKFHRVMRGVAYFRGSLNFHQPKFVIKTRNLNYTLETSNPLLRWIDQMYHAKLISFLHGFLQYNFKSELETAQKEAQEQIDKIQYQNSWIYGKIEELDLERITIEPDGLHGVFLAKGKLNLLA